MSFSEHSVREKYASAVDDCEQPHVAHLLHFDGPGDGPRVVFLHVRYLAQAGYRNTVICGGRGRLTAFCTEAGVPCVHLPFDRPWKVWAGTPALWAWLCRARPALLVLYGQWAGACGTLAARAAGIRHIVYQTHWPAFYTDWDLRRLVRNHILERIPCRLADAVVTPSRSVYYQYFYRRWVAPGKLHFIPNGLDLEDLPTETEAAALCAQLGWDRRWCHVVSVGRLATQKRIDWLLRSWRMVQDAGLPARLWIVGSGEEEHNLRRLATQLGVEKSCAFLGEQANGMLYMAAADVVAMTSMYESFGYVALEAGLLGKPVVANRVDGLRDTLHDGQDALLADAGDVATFAKHLIALIRQPDLQVRLGTAARENAVRFDIKRVMPQFVDLYRDVLGRAPIPYRPE